MKTVRGFLLVSVLVSTATASAAPPRAPQCPSGFFKLDSCRCAKLKEAGSSSLDLVKKASKEEFEFEIPVVDAPEECFPKAPPTAPVAVPLAPHEVKSNPGTACPPGYKEKGKCFCKEDGKADGAITFRLDYAQVCGKRYSAMGQPAAKEKTPARGEASGPKAGAQAPAADMPAPENEKISDNEFMVHFDFIAHKPPSCQQWENAECNSAFPLKGKTLCEAVHDLRPFVAGKVPRNWTAPELTKITIKGWVIRKATDPWSPVCSIGNPLTDFGQKVIPCPPCED